MTLNGIDKYKTMSDHDIAIVTAVKLDSLTDKVDAFITIKQELQKAHECRMDTLESQIESHDTRLNTLETYIKVGVGFIVVAMSVFGVYVLDLMIR